MNDNEIALKKISNHLEKAKQEIAKAEAIALEHKLYFRWDGPCYGAGASFDGKYDKEDSYYRYRDDYWLASSQSC